MLGLHLNLSEIFRSFQRLQKLYLGIVRQSADRKLHKSAPMIETRRDADHAHASGECFPQIGEHFRPGEAPFINERIQETGSIENLLRLGSPKVCLQGGLLLLVGLDLAFEIRDIPADVAIGPPRLIGLMRKDYKK
jgi:hypothetical protein